MARARKNGDARLRVQAEVLDRREGEDEPQLTAYAFGQSGKLLGRAELKGGAVELPVAATKEPAAVRVLVGPAVEGDDQEVLSTLMRLDAAERLVRPDQLEGAIAFPLDRIVWGCWFRTCLVRGKLLKRTSSGGLTVDLPVCGAEVEIYEVDPVTVILPKIPDDILDRLRDVIRRPWPAPPPEERFPGGLPFPPPGPFPGPGPNPGPLFVREAAANPALTRSAELGSVRDELAVAIADLRGEGEATRLGEASRASNNAEGGSQKEQVFRFAAGDHEEPSADEVVASTRALTQIPELVT